MIAQIVSMASADRRRKRTKVTCTTCNLKGCVGRCQWKSVDRPQPPKAA